MAMLVFWRDGLERQLAALNATLRELPSILSCPLAPKYLPLSIRNNDSYVGPVAIFVNHDGFSILNGPIAD